MQLAIDFGLSNVDVVVGDATQQRITRLLTLRSQQPASIEGITRVLEGGGYRPSDFDYICVTGSRHRLLPDAFAGVRIVKVDEIAAIGRGGAWLAHSMLPGMGAMLVVSAGSGTAIVAAQGDTFRHVTGSAVGGGTLLGLSQLLLRTGDPQQVDALAQQGNASHVDLTLADAVGGALGWLPANASAVNFGKAALSAHASFAPEDLAAAIVTLISQVIGVIAVNAARAEGLREIVVVGHLVDMQSVRAVLRAVADLYQVRLHIPDNPGYATAIGAWLRAASR